MGPCLVSVMSGLGVGGPFPAPYWEQTQSCLVASLASPALRLFGGRGLGLALGAGLVRGSAWELLGSGLVQALTAGHAPVLL